MTCLLTQWQGLLAPWPELLRTLELPPPASGACQQSQRELLRVQPKPQQQTSPLLQATGQQVLQR